MLSTSKVLPVISILLAISMFSPLQVLSQSDVQFRLHNRTVSPFRCSDAAPLYAAGGHQGGSAQSLPQSEYLKARPDCQDMVAEEPPLRIPSLEKPPTSTSSNAPATDALDFAPRSLSESPLKKTDNAEFAMLRAQHAVLEILQEENACSAWLRQTDPQVTATFRSLHYRIERDGADRVIRERNDSGDWSKHGPYVARTSENTGPGSSVTLNANGAFFRRSGPVFNIAWLGGMEQETNDWALIHIGPYEGGSLPAQVVALLHELAHIIGAIRRDGSAEFGLKRSQENTDLILQHCKREADASAKHSEIELSQTPPD